MSITTFISRLSDVWQSKDVDEISSPVDSDEQDLIAIGTPCGFARRFFMPQLKYDSTTGLSQLPVRPCCVGFLDQVNHP